MTAFASWPPFNANGQDVLGVGENFKFAGDANIFAGSNRILRGFANSDTVYLGNGGNGVVYMYGRSLGFNAAGVAGATSFISNSISDGLLTILSATGTNAGAWMQLYGKDHATFPNYLTMGNATSNILAANAAGDITFGNANTNVHNILSATDTSASSGGASALPATPATYLRIKVNGVTYRIPCFA